MGEEEQTYSVEYVDNNPELCNWIKREGEVRITYPNGDTFVGSVDTNRLKQGKGKYTWVEQNEDGANNEIAYYDGQYVNGKKNGLGRMVFPTGDSYHGMWKDDKMHGEGSYTYANGDIFSGIYDTGIKEGHGTYEFVNDRSQFIGNWVSGNIVEGKWVFQDGGRYEGRFEEGKPIGQCKFDLHNGIRQDGEYLKIEKEDESGQPYFFHKWKPEALLAPRV